MLLEEVGVRAGGAGLNSEVAAGENGFRWEVADQMGEGRVRLKGPAMSGHVQVRGRGEQVRGCGQNRRGAGPHVG